MNVYIDAPSKILIDECPGYGIQAITLLQSQFTNMTFAEQIRCNIMFQQVVHKGGGSEINYIKIFKDAKVLKLSVQKK